ncbi:glycoside hydrolase family 2 TIM barrel-domain containing protein [Sulfolobus tengchongensis]|uniref:Beta-glucuronidase n=1 Tax=Sulfolobus tengchongensis TaxID=207809 RepID=A0AAX4KXJ2_9CREN
MRSWYRQRISLEGFWKFRLDERDLGEKENWYGGFESDDVIYVPASWNEQNPDWDQFSSIAWYEKKVFINEEHNNKEAWIIFDGAGYFTKVWINGSYIGSHEGSFTKFKFSIKDKLTFGDFNNIIVRIDNKPDVHNLPPAKELNVTAFDFFNYGGIHRPVYIELADECHVEDLTIHTKANGKLRLKAEVNCNEYDLKIRLMDKEMNNLILEDEIKGAKSRIVEYERSVNNVKPWDPESPNLYILILDVYVNHKLRDSVYERIGFRDVEIRNGRIYLNNRPIFLKGFGRHEDFPVLGKYMYGAVLIRDFYLMKKIGANSFRTSHYPYSDEHLDLADELGFLVILEPPLCYSNINRILNKEEIAKLFSDERYLEKAKSVINEMIKQHKNRPSVIMYSVTNEPPSDIPEVAEFIRKIAEYFKVLDPTRGTTFASHRSINDLALGCVDVISLNYYHGWYTEWGEISKGVSIMLREIEEIHKRFPDKPIMITEFGADAILGLHSDPPQMWSEEYQEEMIRSYVETLMRRDYIVGLHIWNFADFRSTQSPMRSILNRKGIFTRDRQPKLSAKTVKELYSKIKTFLS